MHPKRNSMAIGCITNHLKLNCMKKIFLTVALIVTIIAALSAQNNAIRVSKSGKGTPVIFMPGFTSPGSVWKETMTNLKGNYQSHFISYAGFNGIPPIKMPWYETIKKELIEYIQREKLSDVIIIG